jgi:1-pyrroline-5-carboxylate dehydrogenase
MGDPADFENFMGAVIDSSAFKTHADAIAEAKAAGAAIVTGGSTDDSEGYFVQPTVIETDDKGFRLLRDELFGPIVTTYVYDEKRWEDTLELVDETAPYALTGAVFSTERSAIQANIARAPVFTGKSEDPIELVLHQPFANVGATLGLHRKDPIDDTGTDGGAEEAGAFEPGLRRW